MTTREALDRFCIACRAMLAAAEQLQATLPVENTAPAIERVLASVADHYGYTLARIQSVDRTKRVSEARHIGAFLAVEILGAHNEDVARIVNRDHSAIVYARATVRERLEFDPLFAKRFDAIREKVVGEMGAAA